MVAVRSLIALATLVALAGALPLSGQGAKVEEPKRPKLLLGHEARSIRRAGMVWSLGGAVTHDAAPRHVGGVVPGACVQPEPDRALGQLLVDERERVQRGDEAVAGRVGMVEARGEGDAASDAELRPDALPHNGRGTDQGGERQGTSSVG